MEQLFITLGALLLAGLAADAVGRRTHLPRVTLLLLLGVALGPSALDVLPEAREAWFPALAELALSMVGFLIGGEFSAAEVRSRGRAVALVSLGVTLGTALVVGAGLWLAGTPLVLALLLAGVAPATDPAACLDVIEEGRATGPVSKLVLGVVAVDDIWGLLLFSLILAGAEAAMGHGGAEVLHHAAWDIGGAIILGAVLGVPMALLTGRIQPGKPTREEALGMVLLCGGLAMWLEVSVILTAVVMGAVVVNVARHHERAFNEIASIEDPFLVLFFLLSGASLDIRALASLGTVGVGYIVLRILGRLVGGWTGATLARLPDGTRRWIGPALLPQAGVALGLALVAADRLPEASAVLPVVVVSTVFFELVGPLLTRRALMAVGELPPRR